MRKLLLVFVVPLLMACCPETEETDPPVVDESGSSAVNESGPFAVDEPGPVTYGPMVACDPLPAVSAPPVVNPGGLNDQAGASRASARLAQEPDHANQPDTAMRHKSFGIFSRYGAEPSTLAVKKWRDEKLLLLKQVIEDEKEREFHTAELRNSNLTTKRAAIGAVFEGASLETASSICTATLVSCNLAITARHCVPNRESEDIKYWVYFQHTGMFNVNSAGIDVYCDSPGCVSETDQFNDIALLPLMETVKGVEPMPLGNNCDWSPGSKAEIVGFGVSSLSKDDYNLKRRATITLAECQHPPIDERSICYELAPDLPGACNNDSGGPLLAIDDSGEAKLIGVLITGGPMCTLYQARYNNTTSTVFAPWMAERIEQSGNECTAIFNPVKELLSVPEQRLQPEDPAINEREYQFDVEENTDLLLVSLNYPPGFSQTLSGNEFNLQLDKDPGDNEEVSEAAEPYCFNKDNQLSICRMESPTAGSWRAKVSRVKGKDYYQLVATQHKK